MNDWKDRFISEAIEHGQCVESGEFRQGNAAFGRLVKAVGELRGHADQGEAVLTALLAHPNGWVRLGAAKYLLPLRAELASTVLENLASGPQSHMEFDAKMVLNEWRAGRLGREADRSAM